MENQIKLNYRYSKFIFLTILLSLTFITTSKIQAQEKICVVEARDFPGKDPVMWGGLYAAKSGKVYIGLCTEGESAHFYQYDPATDSMRCLADMAEFMQERGKGIRASGKIHNAPLEDNEGNIYFTTMCDGSGPRNIDFTSWRGAQWIRYNPETDKMEMLGLIDDGVGLYCTTIDRTHNVIFGLGFTGYLYRFDIEKRITENLGRVANWDVCRSIVTDNLGNAYGSFPTARIWKYDAQKEMLSDLSLRMPYDPTVFPVQLKNPMLDRTADWRCVLWDSVENVIYGVTCGSGSILFRFDPHDSSEGKITALGKLCSPQFLNSGTKDIPYSTLAMAIGKDRKVYFIPSNRHFDYGAVFETFGTEAKKPTASLIVYNLKTDRREDPGILQTTDGRHVFGCEAATCSPDGTIYFCGAVEENDPKKATGRIVGKYPSSLKLLIYKP